MNADLANIYLNEDTTIYSDAVQIQSPTQNSSPNDKKVNFESRKREGEGSET